MNWIETERLMIRDLQEEDLETFADYRGKAEVAKYQSWDDYGLQEAHSLYAYLQRHPFNGKYGMTQLAIERKEDHQMIGDLYLKIDFFKRYELFLGYTLDSTYWKNGYGQEAVRAICHYAFNVLNLRQVVCYVMWENEASLRLLKRSGFDQIASHEFYQDHTFCLKKCNTNLQEET